MKKDTEIRLYLIDAKKRHDATLGFGTSWDRGANGSQVREGSSTAISAALAPMTGKHEQTPSRRTGLGWFLNWSVIQPLPDQLSSLFSANDILIAINRHKCARYNAIFNTGASCMDLIVR